MTCPHCAQSAPATEFNAASDALGNAPSVPLKRRIIQQPAATLAPTKPVPTSFLGGSLRSPPASEPPPSFSPPSAFTSPFPPAPPANPAWPVGGQPGGLPAVFHTPPGPFALGFSETPPQTQAAWSPTNEPAQTQAPAAWTPTTLEPQEAWEESDPDESLEPYEPPRRKRNIPMALFILGAAALAAWVLWANMQPPLSADIPAVPKPNPTQVNQSATPPAPAPKPSEPETPKPEISSAAPKKAEPAVEVTVATKMLDALFSARSAEERASLVADAEDYRDDMADFFSKPAPAIKSVSPSSLTPQLLPSHSVAPLFQVFTATSAHGALLRLVPQAGGRYLLDWPLFAETHERRLAKFLLAQPPDPAWFHLSLRRSHALGLPVAILDRNFAFDLLGSADGVVRVTATVQRETPLGRFLDRETGWSEVYLARLLLQFRPLEDGSKGVVLLDCEGATTGASESK